MSDQLLYFEEMEVGAVSTAGPHLVTKEELVAFATKYDPTPRHIDEEAAARTMFGGLTATAAQTFAVLVLLTGRLHPRQRTLAGVGWDELRLPNPVRPGDELDLEVTLLEKRVSKSKPDRGIVRRRVLLRNQKRETVLECFASVLIARRPAS